MGADQRKVAQSLLTESLADDELKTTKIGDAAIMVIALGLPPAILALMPGIPRNEISIAVVVVSALVLAIGSMRWMTMIVARARKRRLRELGFGFDAERYFELLSAQRYDSRLIVSMTFKGPPLSEEDGAKAADAARTWSPLLGAARWDAAKKALILESPKLDTTARAGGSRGGIGAAYFTNQPVNRCFIGITKDVLPKLAAVHPLERIEIDIAGAVTPLDEEIRDLFRRRR